MAREFAKEAAQAAAPPPKPRPPAPRARAAALRPLERLLDRLSGVAATARRASSEDPFCNVRARCKVVARAALDARLDARARNFVMCYHDRRGDSLLISEPASGAARTGGCGGRRRSWSGASRRSSSWTSRPRGGRAARDARCAAWLARGCRKEAAALEALCALLEQHRALERSWTFQRALFFEQLRMTGATGGGAGRHEREALSFGTTSFAAFCSLLAAPCLKDARTRGGACVVLGSSVGNHFTACSC